MSDPDPVVALKRQLAREICALVEPVHQGVAAYTFDVDQPLISRLRHGKVDRVSLDRLIRMLHRVGRPVTLTVGAGPPIRFRFTPPGYLGRLAPRPPAKKPAGPAADHRAAPAAPHPAAPSENRAERPQQTPLARRRFAKWLETW